MTPAVSSRIAVFPAFVATLLACSDPRAPSTDAGVRAGSDVDGRPDTNPDDVADDPRDSLANDPAAGRFIERVVFSGLTRPTALRFARDGRVFVAEKSGVIKEFASLTDRQPMVVVDLGPEVHDYGDRGLLDIELDPQFPQRPHIYALYTLDGRMGDSLAAGTVPRYQDACGDPGGACVAGGRLVRLTLTGDLASTNRSQTILVENWPQQFLSHSVGSLAFGPDGMLYAAAGDGASFEQVDYGDVGGNPLREPPDPGSSAQKPPAAMGGALRAQVTEPVGPTDDRFITSFSGKVIRIDPQMATTPLATVGARAASAVVATGLRNPFRMTFRPGSRELWIADVGWNLWEEIHLVEDVNGLERPNFGWPCFEGPGPQPGYEAAGLALCSALYARPAAHLAPVFAYRHDAEVVEADNCGSRGSAVSGLAFYQGGSYPEQYRGSLFFTDFSRRCIWVIPAGPGGRPDPARRRLFAAGVESPVQLRTGPEGDLYYVDLSGAVRRFEYLGGNHPPRAGLAAAPHWGSLPLRVTFDASSSRDADDGEQLAYEWDLDGDGAFDDGQGLRIDHTYRQPGRVTVGVRVTDRRGARSTATAAIFPGAGPPTPAIEAITPRVWKAGDHISFKGQARDWQGRPLPAAALSWSIVLHHCPDVCHEHPLQQLTAVAGGAFPAPDHEYPMHLSITLRADSDGLHGEVRELLIPATTAVTIQSRPPGLTLAFNGTTSATPFSRIVVSGSTNSLSGPFQIIDRTAYRFLRWSDGGDQSHPVRVEGRSRTYRATFEAIPLASIARIAKSIIVDRGGGETRPSDTDPEAERIRDGVKPTASNAAPEQQYLVERMPGSARPVALGYELGDERLLARLVFQEGLHSSDGGSFEALAVAVRRAGQWAPVRNLRVTPAYRGFNATPWESFALDFDPTAGDAVRLEGLPGGLARFVSVAELEVWAATERARAAQ
jgi:glucose/arabinose dehydrogenase